jgi:hypothetical protein
MFTTELKKQQQQQQQQYHHQEYVGMVKVLL